MSDKNHLAPSEKLPPESARGYCVENRIFMDKSTEKSLKPIRISFRITKDDEIEKLQKLLKDNRCSNKSELFRDIIFGRPLKIAYYDSSREELNLKLGELNYQIRRIGININQIVKIIRDDTGSSHLSRMINEVQILENEVSRKVSDFISAAERGEL